MLKKKIVGGAVALVLSLGLVGAGFTAAQAETGTSAGCSTTATKPVKSGNTIRSSGSASCSSTTSRTLFVELHRGEGFWHPIVGTGSNSGAKKSYSASASSCDDGQTRVYFTEAFMNGGGKITSSNTGRMAGSC